jgi:hypothetical protein
MTNQLVLLESRTARQDRLTDVNDDRALEAINKAKALLMASWNSTNIATTEQMAEYYEVPFETVKTVVKRNREELQSDGLKVLKGKDLEGVRFIVNLTQDVQSSLTIWTPRAALRLGMLLRDSLVAQKIRTILLDVAEQQFTKLEAQPKLAFPRASVDPIPQQIAPMSERATCNRLVRDYVFNQSSDQPLNEQDTWRWMYRELKYRYHYDVYARVKKSGIKCKLDQIAADDKMTQLHAICNHFLGN